MLPYSARKKYDQRMPLYSVWNPATSSLSASARSNGARLQLAVAVMKKMKNATNVNGSWNIFQFQNAPTCCAPMVFRFSVPVTQMGTTTHIARGTSELNACAASGTPPNSDHLLAEAYPASTMPNTSLESNASMKNTATFNS